MTLQLSLSTSSSLLRRSHGYAALASRLEMESVDIDATTWIGRRVPGPRRAADDDLQVPIGAIWLSASDLDGSRHAPGESLPSIHEASGAKVDLVVRLSDLSGAGNDQRAVHDAYAVYRGARWARSLTVAVPAIAGGGGRAHLSRLRALVWFAEEWGATIALDLGSRTDRRWEAEAAVQTLGDRLARLRIRSGMGGMASAEAEVTRRTLCAAFERAFTGPITVLPATPLWRSWRESAVTEDLAETVQTLDRLFIERATASWLPGQARIR